MLVVIASPLPLAVLLCALAVVEQQILAVRVKQILNITVESHPLAMLRDKVTIVVVSSLIRQFHYPRFKIELVFRGHRRPQYAQVVQHDMDIPLLILMHLLCHLLLRLGVQAADIGLLLLVRALRHLPGGTLRTVGCISHRPVTGD